MISLKFGLNKIFVIIIFIISFLVGFGFYFINHMISLNGEKTMILSLNDEYYEYGAVVNYGNNKNLEIINNVDNTKIGSYKIEYKTKFLGIDIKKYRYVDIVDDVAPEIVLSGNSEVVICPNAKYNEDGFVAMDNYDGDITGNVKVVAKDDVISYSVFDSSNNSFTINRYVERKDNESPSLKLNGNSTYNIVVGNEFSDPGYVVSDNCSDDVKVNVSGSVDTKKVGTYELVYTAVDESGNSVNVKRYVRVNKKEINNTGVIYLTFDDGPSIDSTPKVLDILDKKGIKATFFVINHSDELNYLIKRAYDAGHSIGLHSYTHSYSKIYSSKENYYNDLSLISDKVEKIIGEKVMIIRFPGGGSNTISKKYNKGIMSDLTKEVVELGYRYYDWNVSSGDAGGAKSSDDVYKNVIKGLRKNSNNIVLMHDFSKSKSVGALEDIIDYGLANGYRFDKIDMTTPMIRHKVNN